MHVVPNKILREKVHQFHVVLKWFESFPGVVGEARGVFYDSVYPVETDKEVGVLSNEGVVFGRGGRWDVSGERGHFKMEGSS